MPTGRLFKKNINFRKFIKEDDLCKKDRDCLKLELLEEQKLDLEYKIAHLKKKSISNTRSESTETKLVFRQTFQKNDFSGESIWFKENPKNNSRNENNINSKHYSILNSLDKFKYNGAFHFIYKDITNNIILEWKQKNNPFNEENIKKKKDAEGFEIIYKNFDVPYFGGLGQGFSNSKTWLIMDKSLFLNFGIGTNELRKTGFLSAIENNPSKQIELYVKYIPIINEKEKRDPEKDRIIVNELYRDLGYVNNGIYFFPGLRIKKKYSLFDKKKWTDLNSFDKQITESAQNIKTLNKDFYCDTISLVSIIQNEKDCVFVNCESISYNIDENYNKITNSLEKLNVSEDENSWYKFYKTKDNYGVIAIVKTQDQYIKLYSMYHNYINSESYKFSTIYKDLFYKHCINYTTNEIQDIIKKNLFKLLNNNNGE
jgi:hypothetical protein